MGKIPIVFIIYFVSGIIYISSYYGSFSVNVFEWAKFDDVVRFSFKPISFFLLSGFVGLLMSLRDGYWREFYAGKGISDDVIRRKYGPYNGRYINKFIDLLADDPVRSLIFLYILSVLSSIFISPFLQYFILFLAHIPLARIFFEIFGELECPSFLQNGILKDRFGVMLITSLAGLFILSYIYGIMSAHKVKNYRFGTVVAINGISEGKRYVGVIGDRLVLYRPFDKKTELVLMSTLNSVYLEEKASGGSDRCFYLAAWWC